MIKRVIFSKSHRNYDEIGENYDVFVNSMDLYYSHSNPAFVTLFQYNTHEEIAKKKEAHLEEIDASLAFTLLASIEASFRIDYLQRCYRKKKDPLSRNFRELHRTKGSRVLLKDEILDGWKEHSNVSPSLLGDIKGAFNYRHWLAHGRYWKPKYGRGYDFLSIFDLALKVDEIFPFEKP